MGYLQGSAATLPVYQHLLVIDFIVPLDGAEAFGEEGNWMPFSPFSDEVCWDKTAPVAMLEELASMQ